MTRRRFLDSQNREAMILRKGHICDYKVFVAYNDEERKNVYRCSQCNAKTMQNLSNFTF